MARRNLALVAGTIAALAGVAHAGISSTVLSIDVSWTGGSTSWQLPREQLVQDPNDPTHFWWEPAGDIQIADGIELRRGEGDNRTRVEIFEDPEVIVNFNVFSTQQNSVFTVNSALVSFAQLNNPVGVASAAVSVTDLSGNGATFTPNGLGGQAYTAFYNSPGNTEFAQLLSTPLSTLPFSTNSYSQDFPIVGTQVIAGGVQDISARWTFTLSQGALATGTSVFTVVPTPASGLLIGAGLLAAGRRRR